MTDPVPDTKAPRTRWMWVGVIALLAVVAVIMFINPDGDESLETIPDHAITTQEERINQPIDINEPGEEPVDELLEGADGESVEAIVITEDADPEAGATAPAE
ncbi:hypothetical protein [Erythrobacter sp. AP23]|uniref:hypothetical protein n=1 Tax=Erythrobacter sp. AP23 TaxID=499656 RepID=UPI00076DBD86|nr:hypothetical protein [Erythrobacter sp. AP23]KWV95057.1 hypothetical protein ASS64_07690 [Erythrobacter sp. AP23]